MEIQEIHSLSDAYHLILKKLTHWVTTFVEMLPNFAVAMLVLLFFVLLAKVVRRALRRFLPKVSDSKNLNSILQTIAYSAIVCIGVFVSLSALQLDKAVTSLLAGAGIVGLALSFAFQNIAINFMSGVMMAIRKPIQTGDLVETNDVFGIVQRVSLRATEIHSLQGQLLIVPNKLIFENVIKNYTKTGRRRVDLSCGVSYGDDLKKVKELTLQTVENLDFVEKGMGVSFFFTEFGSSSINYQVMFWLKKSISQIDYLEAVSGSIMAIKETYDKNNITIPFPIRTLDFGIKGGEKLSTMMGEKGIKTE